MEFAANWVQVLQLSLQLLMAGVTFGPAFRSMSMNNFFSAGAVLFYLLVASIVVSVGLLIPSGNVLTIATVLSLLVIGVFIMAFRKKQPKDNQPINADKWKEYPLTLVEGQTFKSVVVQLDGFKYDRCSFIDVIFEYEGKAPFLVENSTVKARMVFLQSSHSFVNQLQHFIHSLYVTSGYTQQR